MSAPLSAFEQELEDMYSDSYVPPQTRVSAPLSAFLQELEDMYSDSYVPPQTRVMSAPLSALEHDVPPSDSYVHPSDTHVPVPPTIPKEHTALIIGANKTEPHIQTFMSQHPNYTVITWSIDSVETDTHINKDINDDSYLDVFQQAYKGVFKMIIIDKSTTKFIVNFLSLIHISEPTRSY